jgi:hypothetical protein
MFHRPQRIAMGMSKGGFAPSGGSNPAIGGLESHVPEDSTENSLRFL